MAGRVVVVGAGPSGCSAAIALCRAGLEVQLVDKGVRGRDKVCGDALIPDALAALAALGCRAAVLSRAHRVSSLRLCAPSAAPVDIHGELACLPRAQLDALLLAQAEAEGAQLLLGCTFLDLLERHGRVCGVRLQGANAKVLRLPADHVLLATGAAAGPLEASGMCLRRSPSGMALRTYFEVPATLAEELDALTLAYDDATCPGYGWIFAGPGRVMNIGVGIFHDGWQLRSKHNLRNLWDHFVESFPAAARLRRHGRQLAPVRGAPLRTALRGSRLARPGLMVVGEAIGTTYSLSGEGIGKAMYTGMLAAECLARNPDGAEQSYAQRVGTTLRARYEGYRSAQTWLSLPSVFRLLARRAHAGCYVRSQLEAVLAETADPRALLSMRGLLRALVY